MKKVIINGQSLNASERYGIQRNTLHILKELDKKIERGRVELVIPSWEQNELLFDNINVVQVKALQIPKGKKFIWTHIIFPHYVYKEKGLGMDMMLALPLFCCHIVFIYDCIMELFPQNAKTFREKLGRFFYMFKARQAVDKCKLIITDSESAKKDIIDFYHCASDKIKVIYCGWQHFLDIEEDSLILSKLNLEPRSYCFSLGSRYYHKNYKWIICAAKQNPQYTFVVTGTDSLNFSDAKLSKCVPQNVIFTGYLKDSEIKALMKNCKVFIQPSLYEGFGIPPMEAMSVGARCIVAKVASLPEVYENSVWYIDPKNYESIDIDRIMSDRIDSNDKILRKYGWELSAKKLYDILHRM